MARQPRLDLPGIPQHIVQRGNNRLPCFLDDDDRHRYLRLLGESLLRTGCRLHAYVLMGNHVHLLATPPESGAVSRLMQWLGRHYVGQFNTRHGRTGTLWEGRFKSCLVDSETYVLRCYRYIDLNPVRARMVAQPAEYAWSSGAPNLGVRSCPLLSPHSAYLSLGGTAESRFATYEALLRVSLPNDQLAEIRDYIQQQRALGRDTFREMVETRTQRFAGVRPAHRPRSSQRSAQK